MYTKKGISLIRNSAGQKNETKYDRTEKQEGLTLQKPRLALNSLNSPGGP